MADSILIPLPNNIILLPNPEKLADYDFLIPQKLNIFLLLLAENCKVSSEATITRFCRGLGPFRI